MITFTQGDEAELNLTAQDGDGNPIDITGASFETQIKGPNGSVAVFPDGQHTITDAAAGTFSLLLSPTDTGNCGEGENKDIVTKITLSGSPIYYRALGILTVYPPIPLQ